MLTWVVSFGGFRGSNYGTGEVFGEAVVNLD